MSRATRQEVAQHFHVLAQISRTDVFGLADARVKPIHLSTDAETMFPGYVGEQFVAGKGVIIFGINPGGGGDKYSRRIPEDEVLYPLLSRFKHARPDELVNAFDEMNAAFAKIVSGWNLSRILNPTLDALRLSLREVAYMNVVPYRTRNDAAPPVASIKASIKQFIEPTIKILEPRALICLGKKAGYALRSRLQTSKETHVIPRTIGDSYLSAEASAVLIKIRKSFG